MRTSSTFSILFWVYTNCIKNNQVPLYARITVDGKQLNISLKRKIDVALWNPIKQRAKGNSAIAKEINQYMNRVYADLFRCHQDLRLENVRITPQTVKSKYFAEDETFYTMRDITGTTRR